MVVVECFLHQKSVCILTTSHGKEGYIDGNFDADVGVDGVLIGFGIPFFSAELSWNEDNR